MKKKITAILMTAALMLTMVACAGNSTADAGVESSASSAVSSKPVSDTSSTAASSAKPSASAKPTATPSAGAAATVKPTATPKPESKTESSTAGKASATATPKPAAIAKPSSSNTSNSKPSGSAARPTAVPTAKPTAASTAAPTAKPTAAPTAKPTAAPTAAPTAVPTATPKPKEKVWVVDVPAQEEVGHWEDDYWMGSDWVYQCNGCGAQFATTDAFWAHSDANWDEDGNNYHGGYSMVSGEPYKHYTGEKYWVVDTPAQEEIGHWDYR